MKKSILLCLFAVGLFGSNLRAEFFVNDVGLADPGQTIRFDEAGLDPGTLVDNQYADLGVTFSPNMWQSPQDLSGLEIFNIDENWLGNFLNDTLNPISINFESAVEGASFSLITNASETQFTALLDGEVVETAFAFTELTNPNNFYGFEGIVFDEIEVFVDPASNGALGIDNLSFTAIPEPGVGVVLAMGLVAGASRRRRISR